MEIWKIVFSRAFFYFSDISIIKRNLIIFPTHLHITCRPPQGTIPKTACRGKESRPPFLFLKTLPTAGEMCDVYTYLVLHLRHCAIAKCESTEYNNSPALLLEIFVTGQGTLCRLFFAQHVHLPSDLCGICNSIRKTASFVPPPNWWTTGLLIELVISQRNRPPCVLQATTRISNKKRKREKGNV